MHILLQNHASINKHIKIECSIKTTAQLAIQIEPPWVSSRGRINQLWTCIAPLNFPPIMKDPMLPFYLSIGWTHPIKEKWRLQIKSRLILCSKVYRQLISWTSPNTFIRSLETFLFVNMNTILPSRQWLLYKILKILKLFARRWKFLWFWTKKKRPNLNINLW